MRCINYQLIISSGIEHVAFGVHKRTAPHMPLLDRRSMLVSRQLKWFRRKVILDIDFLLLFFYFAFMNLSFLKIKFPSD